VACVYFLGSPGWLIFFFKTIVVEMTCASFGGSTHSYGLYWNPIRFCLHWHYGVLTPQFCVLTRRCPLLGVQGLVLALVLVSYLHIDGPLSYD